jgi:hypothetical protein
VSINISTYERGHVDHGALVNTMCPLRCHYLRVLDGMVDMFIDTLNVSSKMSSTCPLPYDQGHVDHDILEDTLNASINISTI